MYKELRRIKTNKFGGSIFNGNKTIDGNFWSFHFGQQPHFTFLIGKTFIVPVYQGAGGRGGYRWKHEFIPLSSFWLKWVKNGNFFVPDYQVSTKRLEIIIRFYLCGTSLSNSSGIMLV